MPRRPLPDTRERKEQRVARSVQRLAVGILVVLGLAILVLYLIA